ncbi:hypothetical protein P3W85_16510 [Cupriavidus basilensis]|uniref:AAA family ATPase n=1 Tax=Cupriavidus basilensis TaxID=68895 RepID=A0ABT6APJ6_9BURK|nr:hypothetical protein [Cupriavidus basilensis]MDF3834546.1 hypothetical protein [Cupriavidus basilensis]
MTNLVLICGPSAVGKSTVGLELARLTGYPLLQHHETAIPVAKVHGSDGARFEATVARVRTEILRAAVSAGLPGVITTFRWRFGSAADLAFVGGLRALCDASRSRLAFVELAASFRVRSAREGSEPRVWMKPWLADVIAARGALAALLHQPYAYNSNGGFPYPNDWLLSNTEEMTPAEVAQRIIERFALPRRTAD